MSEEKRYIIEFTTTTMATSRTEAVEIAQEQVREGHVYVRMTEEGGEPWEFQSVQSVRQMDEEDMEGPEPEGLGKVIADISGFSHPGIGKTEAVKGWIDKINAGIGNKPEDRSHAAPEFDYLLNRLPPGGTLVIEEFGQASGKIKRAVAHIYTGGWKKPSKKLKRKAAKLARKRWKKEKKRG